MISKKEHPILFSAEMVRAILEGTKTQTRRIIKSSCEMKRPAGFKDAVATFVNGNAEWSWPSFPDFPPIKIKFPYGQVGETLWVKENFIVQQVNKIFSDCWMNHICIDFPASKGQHTNILRKWFWLKESETPKVLRRKHPDKVFTSPSIFLPKKCSRIHLEILTVRIEKLHDINEAGVKSEGAGRGVRQMWLFGLDQPGRDEVYRRAFKNLWEEINGSHSWRENPWVWVIEFKRIETIK